MAQKEVDVISRVNTTEKRIIAVADTMFIVSNQYKNEVCFQLSEIEELLEEAKKERKKKT